MQATKAPRKLMTSSRLSKFRGCPAEAYYAYDVGLERIAQERGALAFGIATHAGLEVWWKAVEKEAFEFAGQAALTAAQDAYTEQDPFARAMLRAMIVAYDARWIEWAKTVTVLGVEVEFRAPLVHPTTGEEDPSWSLAGKMDFIARLADGRIAIGEHKTSAQDASAGSDYRRRLTLDGQISVYYRGIREMGLEADLCLYDVLQKPAIRPLKATPVEDRVYSQPRYRQCKECKRKRNPTPPPHVVDGVACEDGQHLVDPGGKLRSTQRDQDESPIDYEIRLLEAIKSDPDRYFVHAEIVRTPSEEEAHAWQVWRWKEQMDEVVARAKAEGTVLAVPKNPSNCFHHGRKCSYLDICEGTASARDKSKFRIRENLHPELSQVEEED